MNDNDIPTPRIPGRPTRRHGLIAFATFVLAATATTAVAASRDGEPSAFVPMTPCRLLDTRPEPDRVGSRSEPIAAGETYIQQVTGNNGNCTVPDSATAISMNATAVGATAPSFATFFPADAEMPHASSLNYVPGQPPVPNQIDVRLSADGAIGIYNAYGSVDLIVDVAGYYTGEPLRAPSHGDHSPSPENDSYTRAELDAMFDTVTDRIASIDTYDRAELDAMFASTAGTDEVADAFENLEGAIYTSEQVDELLAGKVDVEAASWEHALLGDLDVIGTSIYPNGDQVGPSPHTSTRLGIGNYELDFWVTERHYPANARPVVTVSAQCAGIAAPVSVVPNVADGNLHHVTVSIRSYNVVGAPKDCRINAFLLVRQPD